MIYKKWFILFLITIACISTQCSKKQDISGIYVHYQGEQRYYTLTIAEKENNTYALQLEGVPLEQMKEVPWSTDCTAALQGTEIKCETFTLSFNKNFEEANITYSSGSKQVFISNKINIEEERTLYETANESK